MLHAPATQRNRDPILAELRRVLPPSGLVLEIASGSGEHAVYFAAALPALHWQPTDPDPGNCQSIAAWRDAQLVPGLLAPRALDVHDQPWPFERADAIVAINLIHIAPWSATEALLAGASTLLAPGAPLVLYGPYRQVGVPTAPSNLEFDRSLRDRHPSWGLRSLEDVVAAAASHGLALAHVVSMPANNLTVVLRRVAPELAG